MSAKYPNHVGYIWARESNESDEEIYSIQEQVDQCMAQADRDGVYVPPENVFRVQFSGVNLFKIPELQTLWRRIESDSQPKIIYCWVQDRLIRGKARTDIFYITTRCREASTKLFLVKKQIELTSASIGQDFEILVDGHKAQSEIEDILDRTWRRGRLRRMKDGKISNAGPRKYGFRVIKETGKAVAVEQEAGVIRRIADLKEAGYGFQTIAKILIAEGIPSPRKKDWSAHTVRAFFIDPAYKGEGYGWRYSRGKGKSLKVRSPDDWVKYADDAYPAIIEPKRWDRINALIQKNKGDRARNDHRFSLLRGLVFCSCGHRAYFCQRGNEHGRGKGNYDYYACGRRGMENRRRLPVTCFMKPVSADQMEKEVWLKVSSLLSDPDSLVSLLQSAMPEQNSATVLVASIASLENARREKDAELGRLASRLRQASDLIASHIEAEMMAVEGERRLIDRQIADAKVKIAEQGTRQQQLADLRSLAESFTVSLEIPKELQRSVLESLPFHYFLVKDSPRWEIRAFTEP